MKNFLFCYDCQQRTNAYTCEHCGSKDVEPFDTDSYQQPDYSLSSQELDDGNNEDLPVTSHRYGFWTFGGGAS